MKSLLKLLNNKSLYEVDSTLYLFIVGLGLGIILFFSLKALWVFVLYIIFLLSIILHDLIQIAVANYYGLRLKKFVIYPFGTKKMYGEDFDTPEQEIYYALSGLIVYLIVVFGFAIITNWLLPQYWPQDMVLRNTLTAQTFDSVLIEYPLFSIFWINFLLLLFNSLILVAPMDGGRLLKAILTKIFGSYSANRIVPLISKIISFLIIGVGILFWDIVIILVGIFVYFVSNKEIKEFEILMVLSDKKVNDFVKSVELIFKSNTKIDVCFDNMKSILVPDAIVDYGNGSFGVVDADKLSNVPKSLWPSKAVGDVAEEIEPATDKEKLGFIAQYMVEKNLSVLPVVHNRTGVLIGIIKRTDLADFLKIHKVYG